MSKKNMKPYRLLVVAHPDDETLFFSAVLMQKSKIPFKVICVTSGNEDGTHHSRALQFKKACKKLKVAECLQLDFPDIYENRLDINKLINFLKTLPEPSEIFTHGIIGEYGHPHHQDVSFAVHKCFQKKIKVWVPAYNCAADRIISLTKENFKIKTEIYSEIYKGETLRFSQFIPNRNTDEFAQLEWGEVQEIYSSICAGRAPKKNKLKKYKWYHSFLALKNKTKTLRPF